VSHRDRTAARQAPSVRLAVGTVALLALLQACGSGDRVGTEPGREASGGLVSEVVPGTVTLAFAGDVHFEDHLADRVEDPEATLGPMSGVLRDADLAMVNLESALTFGGTPTSKELENPSERYWFRTPPAALELLARSGVDAVSMANNHGADFGAEGLRETLRADRESPVAVLGVGDGRDRALEPYRVSVRGVDVAVLAADASPRESADAIWDVGNSGPGIAAAREPGPLLDAVRAADRADDVVVVYLHWGEERASCPTGAQQELAAALASAGADVIVGSHAHVLQGAGMLDGAYVAYGLGGFHWYHGARPETGVLQVRVTADGEVVDDELAPALIPDAGGPAQPLDGGRAGDAVADWRNLRGCTGFAPGPGQDQEDWEATAGELPAYSFSTAPIGPDLRRRMIGSSHDPDTCPVPIGDLRHLTLSYIGFDGRAHDGEMVVHADLAEDVAWIFEELYRARWPIRRMELVDAYGGDDDRSMAADNTSGYNCRQVAGQDGWSDHAYGRAVDINPVENPYLTGDAVLPPAGRRYVSVDRSVGVEAEPGVITRGDVVTRAFQAAGWTWGGEWIDPDYQHFSAP
jgi:poly-gamma-glutamate capsule biosynthesis protein CapA/YwtB (metallophosphatase superfamily)